MRRTRDFELGTQLVAHQSARGVVGEVNAKRVSDPLLDRTEGRKAVWLGQGVLYGLELVRRQGFALASGNVDSEQGGQTTVAVGGEPAPHGIAVNPQEPGNLLARVGLIAGEEIQGVEALGRMPFLDALAFNSSADSLIMGTGWRIARSNQ